MSTLGTPTDGFLEAHEGGPMVADMIEQNRSRLDAATRYVERTTDGASGMIRLLGASGRFLTKPIATAAGEVWRSARETVEAGRDAARGDEPSGTPSDSIAA